jgi:hypothetical protein
MTAPSPVLDFEPTIGELLADCYAIARRRARERANAPQPTTTAAEATTDTSEPGHAAK